MSWEQAQAKEDYDRDDDLLDGSDWTHWMLLFVFAGQQTWQLPGTVDSKIMNRK